jgi:hypothetical protein
LFAARSSDIISRSAAPRPAWARSGIRTDPRRM